MITTINLTQHELINTNGGTLPYTGGTATAWLEMSMGFWAGVADGWDAISDAVGRVLE